MRGLLEFFSGACCYEGMRGLLLAMCLTGCQVPDRPLLSDLATADLAQQVIDAGTQDLAPAVAELIQYSIVAPFTLNGTSPVGPDGDVFSDVPKPGGDPYALLFSYRGLAVSFQRDVASGCCNEDDPIAYAQVTMSGSQSCSAWRGTYKMYAPTTAARWHLSIDAQCTGNAALYLRGDWRAAH